MASNQTAMLLREKWDKLVIDFPQREMTDHHYAQLTSAYSGKKRFYHNLSHLEDLYRYYERYGDEIREPQVFEFAIWYHDFIYRVLHGKANEKLSARKARLQLQQLQWDPAKIRQVEALILDTRFHRIEASAGLPDAPWLLDMDLAILGAEPLRYDEYCEQIRREYWVIPSSVFKSGRIQALRQFLQRERIFHTDVFFEEREGRARENIQRELSSLH